MKNARKLLVILAALASAGLVFLAYAEETFSLEQVPEIVRKTIVKYAEDGEIREIELEKEHGNLFYEVEVMKEGREVEFMVSTEGEFLGFEQEDEDDEEEEEIERKIDLAEAPEAVREIILKSVGNNPIKEVEVEIEDGVAKYEVEYMVNGVEHGVECSATGEILELEHVIDVKSLPAAALRAINEKYPGAAIKEVEAVQVFFYEVEFLHNGKKREIKVFATGDIEDEDHEHEDDHEEEDED